MNPLQLATPDECHLIASTIGTAIGKGVMEAYVPQYLGPYAAPKNGEALFYHFKFKNGADGFNVGLIRTTIARNPSRWMMMLASEVNSAASTDTALDDSTWAVPDSIIRF